mgnify:CR=1 FL=1
MSRVRLNLSLDEKVVKWLKVTAATSHCSISELVEEMVKERMDNDDDYGSDYRQKICIECGRKFTGYGGKCPDCRQPPSDEERERAKRAWERLKSELRRLGLWEE